MKCPKCGKEVELRNQQVGIDDNGEPVFNEFAICRDCKKQWNLDKQRAKKAVKTEAPEYIAAPVVDVPKAPKMAVEDTVTMPHISLEEVESVKAPKPVTGRVKSERPEGERPRRKRPRPENQKNPRSGNIPAEKVRTKSEKAVKRNYEDMLATDPSKKPMKKKPRPELAEKSNQPRKKQPVKNRVSNTKKKAPAKKAVKIKPKFKALRIILGVLSIFAFVFFGYKAVMAGLTNITDNSGITTGTVYIILALCFLVGGLISICMKNITNVIAFIFPALFHVGGGAFTLIKMQGDRVLLYGAIASVVLAAIYFLLTAMSRERSYSEDDEYDDVFDDFE